MGSYEVTKLAILAVWFRGTNALIGIAHEGIQFGDLVYTFGKCSKKPVVRPGKNEYTIVGTAAAGAGRKSSLATNDDT